MRDLLAKRLTELSQSNPELFLIYGDIGNRLFDEFKTKNNGRYMNAGIAESSMVTLAAGMARFGFRPIVYTINSFLYLKAIEQIKIDICYPNLPVILIGTGSALSYSELGTTHHSLEDFGILSTIPNLQLISPADSLEVAESLEWAINSNKPTYIRLGKKENLLLHKGELGFKKENFGPFQILKFENASAAILSTGAITGEAYQAVIDNDLNLDLWSIPQIKPIGEDIFMILKQYSKLFIIEEHNFIGGLGSMLAALYAQKQVVTPKMFFINTGDQFHTGLGNIGSARELLKLDPINLKLILKAND